MLKKKTIITIILFLFLILCVSSILPFSGHEVLEVELLGVADEGQPDEFSLNLTGKKGMQGFLLGSSRSPPSWPLEAIQIVIVDRDSNKEVFNHEFEAHSLQKTNWVEGEPTYLLDGSSDLQLEIGKEYSLRVKLKIPAKERAPMLRLYVWSL